MSISSPGYFDRKPSTAQVRPGLAHLQAGPSSPHTPQRAISSAVSSPSVSFRAEEEPLIFEFGARHFSAGVAGESYPRCLICFGPEKSRRVGDYRRWLPGWEDRPRTRRRIETWGDGYELWRMDVRGLDMGLVEDKIERSVREAYTKHLLLDYKSSKKLILVLPSVMPHQLLNLVLMTLFQGSPAPPAITLLSPPALATAAAGCRSSLLVDIGWRETLVTAVYEYREVQQRRTARAMRWVTIEMAKILEGGQQQEPRKTKGYSSSTLASELEQIEEIVTRLAWCRSRQASKSDESSLEDQPTSIPSPCASRQTLNLPFAAFAKPVEESFLANHHAWTFDDHENPLDLLIYSSLLALPADVRSLCMSRIIITGGGSNIPGLKARLIEEVGALVEERGWDAVSGRRADERRKQRRELMSQAGDRTPTTGEKTPTAGDETPKLDKGANVLGVDGLSTLNEETFTTTLPPNLDPRLPDFIDEKFLNGQDGRSKPNAPLAGLVRGLDTMGAWAGASLLATLRIKGIVEIEKETFLQHGLAGARKDADNINVAPPKGIGSTMPKAGERVSWTLGAWA